MFARLLAGLALAAVTTIAMPVVSAETTVDADVSLVKAAIIDAVRQRMAPTTVVVTVDAIADLRLAADVHAVTAHVSPYARIGEPARFVLTAPGGTRGEATAVIQVKAEGVRARTIVRRGTQIVAGDVESLQVDLARRPIRPVPQLVEVAGARALRDLEPGAVVTKADVAPMPLVRAGRTVVAHATIGDARVTGSLVAVQNGARNQIIRVINPETRETRRARVTGVDEVEVVHGR